jgi:polyisoprenoid-binding protein YceI
MATTTGNLDLAHSEMQFKIKHLMIANVTGSFKQFEVTATTEDEDFATAKASFKAHVDSITTNNDQRDGHLKSPEFFDAATFPFISFESTSIVAKEGGYELTGDLTIKDVTKSETMNVELGGITKDPYGQTKVGFTLSGTINRRDFGLTWNVALETGGVMVGEQIKIQAELQLIKQA